MTASKYEPSMASIGLSIYPLKPMDSCAYKVPFCCWYFFMNFRFAKVPPMSILMTARAKTLKVCHEIQTQTSVGHFIQIESCASPERALGSAFADKAEQLRIL
jgi:hypothetical protein